MAGKRKNRTPDTETESVQKYYDLHSDAIDDLVHADESNSPEVSEEELSRYRSGPKIRLADWLKAVLIKIWFAGSVCFFIFWGLSGYLGDFLDQVVVFAVALGVVTDILTNNIFRFYAKVPGGNDCWMMFPKKRFVSFFLNIVYAGILMICTMTVYGALNLVLLRLSPGKDTAPLGVGPILFGLIYTLCDLMFLGMKVLLKRILSDSEDRVRHRTQKD